MNPRCAAGSGDLRRYVKRIDWRADGGCIRLAGSDVAQMEIACTSEEELRARCRQLAEERYPFQIGGADGWGPAEIMSKWQEDGLMTISFLQVSWKAPGEWQLHEILPGVSQWDIRTPKELFESASLSLATPRSGK
jgi:hypothetical protein